MSELSEEKIIKRLKDTISLFNGDTHCFTYSDNERVEAIQGLLDLYQKEKEKNEKLEDKIKARIEELQTMYNNLPKNPKEHLHSKTEYKIVIGELEELSEERN